MVYTVLYKTSSFAGYCFLDKNSIHPKGYGVFSFKAFKAVLVKIQICSFIVYIKKYGIGAEDYIFQNQKGKAYHYSSFRWSMKKIFNENHELFQEYNFKSHDFRHTIATMFYEDGVPLQSVRDYLGHDYEEMTQQYVDYMPKRISKANQELFAKEGSSLASGIKRCKRGK